MQVQDYVYARHGDVLLKPCTDVKLTGRFNKSALLHQGQNHHHMLKGGEFRIQEKEGVKLLQVKKQTTLTHEEHGPIKLKAGIYLVEIQQEFDHFLEESRNVID